MQVSSEPVPLPYFKYALLRWFEDPRSKHREEVVEIVNDHAYQTVVRSALELHPETKVSLITEDYTEESVVRACQSEETWFLLTLEGSQHHGEARVAIDPGVFSVNDFLSETQEAAILEEVAEEVLLEQAMSGLGAGQLPGASPWQAVQPGSAAVTANSSVTYSGQTQSLRH